VILAYPDQLETAIASSPFNIQFATMDEDDQAVLRGDPLKHLVIRQYEIRDFVKSNIA
jgi:hypothetical protein